MKFSKDKKAFAHGMMRYGAYAMILDGGVKLVTFLLAPTFVGHMMHGLHEIVGVLGSNGAAIAGLGAVIDVSTVEHAVEAVKTAEEQFGEFNGLGG